MNNRIIYMSVISLGLFIGANTAFATDIVQTNAGDPVTIATNAPNVGPAFSFTPSTNVVMEGGTDAAGTEFAIQAYHTSVVNKNSGKAFGMASDSSAVYFLDISGTALDAIADLANTDSTSFTGGNWVAM